MRRGVVSTFTRNAPEPLTVVPKRSQYTSPQLPSPTRLRLLQDGGEGELEQGEEEGEASGSPSSWWVDCPDSPSILGGAAARTCLSHGGLQRCWYTYTAGTASATTATPLVVDIHGLQSCAEQMTRFSGWREAADAHGFVVVWPQASQSLVGYAEPYSSWNAGRCCSSSAASYADVDDVGFLRRMIASVLAAHTIDPSRVYFAGHSNGCMMAQRMALNASDLIAAVGCHGGFLVATPDADAFPAQPPGYAAVPVMLVHGTADVTVTWNRSWSESGLGGGLNNVTWPGAMHNLAMWAQLNGCTNQASVQWYGAGKGRYGLHKHTACSGGSEVVLMELPGEGHFPYPSMGGIDVNTTRACWDFVSRFTRGSDPYPASLPPPPPLPPPALPPNAREDGSADSTVIISAADGGAAGLFACIVLGYACFCRRAGRSAGRALRSGRMEKRIGAKSETSTSQPAV